MHETNNNDNIRIDCEFMMARCKIIFALTEGLVVEITPQRAPKPGGVTGENESNILLKYNTYVSY